MATPAFSRDQVMEQVRERIFRYSSSRIGAEKADDLTQDALMLLITKYRHLDSPADLIPVGIRIMQFLIKGGKRDYAARREVDFLERAEVLDFEADPEEKARATQHQRRLMAAVDRLGPRCRELFLLKLEGYNFLEIKEKMAAKSINTVYTWDFRCKDDLRRVDGGLSDANA
jgi:RNA polymerase sigma-70 factor (ECF subfamily)